MTLLKRSGSESIIFKMLQDFLKSYGCVGEDGRCNSASRLLYAAVS